VPILEKAVAKLFGNYEMLQGGWMGPAVQAMTGAPYYSTWHEDITVDKLWTKIHDALNDNWMLTAASQTGSGSD
jgi:hypothetical protein